MATTGRSETDRLGTAAYVVGGMSFIPLIGVLFGVAAIVWGLVTKKSGGKRLAAIGGVGIVFTLALYGALFYFGFSQRGGIYDYLRVQLAQSTINSLVPSIEFYRIQNGKYPESLKVLQETLPKEGFVSVFDPTVLEFSAQSRYFLYERVGEDHYYLRGLGADGKPFTSDDIVPQVPAVPGSKSGLLVERKSDS